MIVRALRRLATALSLVVGVSLVLFLIFDSGVLGDPSLREAGRYPSLAALGESRLRLGMYARFQAASLHLELEGPEQRFVLAAEGDRLVWSNPRSGWSLALDAGELTVGEFVARSELEAPWRLRGRAEDPALPATGLAAALRGVRANLDSGRPLDLPWAEPVAPLPRFLKQMGALLRFDLGRTARGEPIVSQLWTRGRRSLALAAPAFLLATLLAVTLALWTAARRGWLDRGLSFLAVLAMSLPSLAYILFLQRWLAADLGWFPVHGWQPPYLLHLALPVLIWILVSLPFEWRFYRTVMLEEVSKGYVQSARARGLSAASVLRRHVLPNALLPLLTQVIVALPFLVLGSLLLERFFGIPGLGGWTVEAVFDGDQQVLRAIAFVFALLYLAAQWITDLAYLAVDPRLRRSA